MSDLGENHRRDLQILAETKAKLEDLRTKALIFLKTDHGAHCRTALTDRPVPCDCGWQDLADAAGLIRIPPK